MAKQKTIEVPRQKRQEQITVVENKPDPEVAKSTSSGNYSGGGTFGVNVDQLEPYGIYTTCDKCALEKMLLLPKEKQ